MGLLLIDVGNTQLKWVYDSPEDVFTGSCPSQSEGLRNQLRDVKSAIGVPDSIAVACVKSLDYKGKLISCLVRTFGVEPYVASVSRCSSGVTCSYENPLRMGVDRWLAMIAVRAKVDGAFCVIDCGSAVTVDWVDSQGRHLGGFILPGLKLALSALLQGTDQVIVDSDELLSANIEPGVSTTQAVYNGAVFSLVAQVEAAYKKMLQMAGSEKCTLMLTGGDASLLSSKINVPHQLVNELVFDGLRLAFKASLGA